MLLPGARLGHATLVRILSRGGVSDVWLAKYDDGKEVAVRIPRLPRPTSARAERAFTAQIRRAMLLRHPGLVRVLGTDTEEGQRWVAIEYVDGIDLRQIMDRAVRLRRWPSFEVAASIALSVADALTYLHTAVDEEGAPLGIPHRSVYPAKVLVDRVGGVKLADISCAPFSEHLIKTASRAPLGKAAYLSPELARDSQSKDPRSDIFCLGIVLWELLAHRPLFQRDSELDTFSAVLEAVVPGLAPNIPPSLSAIAARCLERKVEDRYQTSAELTAALRGAIAELPDVDPERLASLVPRETPTASSSGPAPVAPVNDTAQMGGRTLAATPDAAERQRAAARAPSVGDPFFDPVRDGPGLVGARFELLAVLGEGGMGEVYRVLDRELDEIVALKVMSRSLSGDRALIDRMRREVKLARKIRSDRVCRIHDIVELPDDGRGVTMELLEGKTLAQLVRDGVPVDYERIAGWGADIAEGLAAAHAVGIVHRDLKPDNVMITLEDRAMILDFGVARTRDDKAATGKLTEAGIILGTIPYMAPEQLRDLPLDGRCDLYALGLLLAELITGEVPFGSNSYHEVLERRVVHPKPYRLCEADPGAPGAMAAVVDGLLKPNRDDRPSSAERVAAELREIGRGITAPIARPHQAITLELGTEMRPTPTVPPGTALLASSKSSMPPADRTAEIAAPAEPPARRVANPYAPLLTVGTVAVAFTVAAAIFYEWWRSSASAQPDAGVIGRDAAVYPDAETYPLDAIIYPDAPPPRDAGRHRPRPDAIPEPQPM